MIILVSNEHRGISRCVMCPVFGGGEEEEEEEEGGESMVRAEVEM